MSPRSGEALGAYDAGIKSVQAFTPGADLILAGISRGIYIGGAGNVQVQFASDGDSNQPTLTALATGVWHPMQIQKIINAGTTATEILVGF
jgi:hypothetical protein